MVLPFYNRPALLREALDSVSQQTHRDWECVLVDDGSTDQSAEIGKSWLKKNRGQLIRLPHCGMPGLARNRGAAQAKGDWIAFLDSDDLWLPEKLKRQWEHSSTSPEIRLWHCREIWKRGEKTISQKTQRHRREGDIFPDALNKCIIGPSTVMIDRNLWEESSGFREDLEVAEDYELWLRMTALEQTGYLNEPLIQKRAGDWDQLSEKYGQIEIFRIRGLKDLVESRWFAENAGEEKQKAAEEELVRKCGIYALGCRKRGKENEAKEYETLAARFNDRKG